MRNLDLALEDRVQTAIDTNPYLAGRKLRFEAEAGRVRLRGVVQSFFQKQMAQEALRHIHGVASIENDLEVAWGSEPTAHTFSARETTATLA
jgi:osmotically-inducible protein OsmY